MSLAVVRSRALLGVTAPPVSVEVHVGNGLPAFSIVGLPEAEVRESRERVRAALLHVGFDFPNRRLTVNLAPADLPKNSGRFDLPIALGILAASGQLPLASLCGIEFVGELSLTGALRPIRGALAMAAAVARDPGASRLVLPADNSAEAALIRGLCTQSARTLPELVAQLRGEAPFEHVQPGCLAQAAAPSASLAQAAATSASLAQAAAPSDSLAQAAAPSASLAQAAATSASLGQVAASSTSLAPVPAAAAQEANHRVSAAASGGAERGSAQQTTAPGDFAEVKGHRAAKRALEIAAAGRHSALMLGPPGAGKSLLAARVPSILPPMSEDEALEAAAVASLVGRFSSEAWGRRPFRAPHHSASTAAIVGGGSNPRPGEISLAHRGVLFLDELPEFGRSALEALREPLETGRIALSRAARQLELPADFQLIAAMNPCPCGYLGDNRCRCTPEQVLRYQARLSGPLLDRIDLQVVVRPVDERTLSAAADGESSAAIAARVAHAHARQQARQRMPNTALGPAGIDRHCRLEGEALAVLHAASRRMRWSSRAMHRVQRLARTIADLAGRERIEAADVAEAVGYRRALLGAPVVSPAAQD